MFKAIGVGVAGVLVRSLAGTEKGCVSIEITIISCSMAIIFPGCGFGNLSLIILHYSTALLYYSIPQDQLLGVGTFDQSVCRHAT